MLIDLARYLLEWAVAVALGYLVGAGVGQLARRVTGGKP